MSIPFLSDQQLVEVFNQTKTATAIHITEDAIIQMANDAMIKIWDKDRSVIGKSLEEALPELKGQPFIDMFKRVWNEGLTISGTDTPADLVIDGRMETVYFDFEYRAILDEQGNTMCILHTATDVTDRYLRLEAVERAREKEEALEREQRLNEELAVTNEELSSLNEEYLQSQESLVQLNQQLEVRVDERTKELADSVLREKAANDQLQHTNRELAAIVEQQSINNKALQESKSELEESQKNLQSLNEELSAINEEMISASEELVQKNNDLSELQESLQLQMHALADSETRFRSLIEQSPVAIALFRSRDLFIEIVNDKMLDVWAKKPEIMGMPLILAMPELEGQPFIQILQDVFITGETYYGYESKGTIMREGILTDGYFNFICQPIKDENGHITAVLQVVSEITEQIESRIELQKAEETMRFAIEAARLGSWFIDPVTKDLKYNSMLAKLFGYEGEENMTFDQALGQVTPEYLPEVNAAIDRAINHGGDYDIVYSQRRFNDGAIIWLRSIGKVTLDEAGNSFSFSGFVMDVTNMKKDDQRKNDFIGMVSHELKTPLTSLSGYIQILQSKARKAEDTFTISALEVAGKQIKKMTSMINGFLNISRLESGKITLDKTTFKLNELIETTVSEMMMMESSHLISFRSTDLIEVYADQDKISNVLSNLLSNAVKYSATQKNIEVDCKIDGDMALVSVKDQGIGIKPEDIDKLFERYYRVENSHTISGFGIGLYLSAEIIERHNGKIWAESNLGEGAVFYFSLPLVK